MGADIPIDPRERLLEANRLRHHLLEWGDGDSVVLLLHGFLEHAHAWDRVAPAIAAAGHHVFALDWRGHGDSEWIGRGGYYHFADYTADLAGIVRGLGGRVGLVGHSMGASAALIYAGTEPDRVRALCCVDALGPPGSDPADAPARFRSWLADLERTADHSPVPVTLDEATARIAERFPRFDTATCRHMAEHGTRPAGGSRVWKYDPLHRTTLPQPYYRAQAEAFWRATTCPVLYIDGGQSPLRHDEGEIAARLAALRGRRVTIPDCGHHPHLERPGELAATIVRFLGEVAP